MPTSALAIVTRGMIYPPEETSPVVCEKPMLTAVVEVRPKTLAVIPAPTTTPENIPVILSAGDLKPDMSAEGPDVATVGDKPKVLSAEDLRPTIREAEEE